MSKIKIDNNIHWMGAFPSGKRGTPAQCIKNANGEVLTRTLDINKVSCPECLKKLRRIK